MKTKKRRLSWNCVEKYIEEMASEVVDRQFKVDGIISIGRGGMIPSRLLADKLGIKDIFIIQATNYIGYKKSDMPIVEIFSHNIEGKNILLVDDIMDSGDTVTAVLSGLRRNKANRIMVATLTVRHTAPNKPSIYGKEIKNDDWIVFPWETFEFKGD